MSRSLRWFGYVVAGLSLVLCLASVVLWLWSYWSPTEFRRETVEVNSPTEVKVADTDVRTSGGMIEVRRSTNLFSEANALAFEDFARTVESPEMRDHMADMGDIMAHYRKTASAYPMQGWRFGAEVRQIQHVGSLGFAADASEGEDAWTVGNSYFRLVLPLWFITLLTALAPAALALWWWRHRLGRLRSDHQQRGLAEA